MIDVTVAKGEPELVVTAKGLYLHRENPGYPDLTLCGRHAAGPAGGADHLHHLLGRCRTCEGRVPGAVRAGRSSGTALASHARSGLPARALGGDHPVGHVTAAANRADGPLA